MLHLTLLTVDISELSRSYEERVELVESIVQQHKQPTIFETFSAQVFSPASLPGKSSQINVLTNVLIC